MNVHFQFCLFSHGAIALIAFISGYNTAVAKTSLTTGCGVSFYPRFFMLALSMTFCAKKLIRLAIPSDAIKLHGCGTSLCKLHDCCIVERHFSA